MIKLYRKYSTILYDQKLHDARILHAKIKELERELNKDENDPMFNSKTKKFKSYIEYVLDLDEKKKTILFDVREATGDGNYTDPLTWSLPEINEYLELKRNQIEKLKAKNGK